MTAEAFLAIYTVSRGPIVLWLLPKDVRVFVQAVVNHAYRELSPHEFLRFKDLWEQDGGTWRNPTDP